jgi:hypothetical protein
MEEPREEDLPPKPEVPEVDEDNQVPGEDPVAEEDFTDAATAAEHPEMDDAEDDVKPPAEPQSDDAA